MIVLHFANFFLSIPKAIFKQFNIMVNHKSSGKTESVTIDVVAEGNQEECRGIQDQGSAEVQASMYAFIHVPNLMKKKSLS